MTKDFRKSMDFVRAAIVDSFMGGDMEIYATACQAARRLLDEANPIRRECVICGKLYVPQRPTTQLYCSRICQNKRFSKDKEEMRRASGIAVRRKNKYGNRD